VDEVLGAIVNVIIVAANFDAVIAGSIKFCGLLNQSMTLISLHMIHTSTASKQKSCPW